jgi:hypothetical protein
MRRWRMFLVVVRDGETPNKTLRLTEIVGRDPESEDSKPSANTEDCIAKIKETFEVDERTTTLAITAGLARRDTQRDRVTNA